MHILQHKNQPYIELERDDQSSIDNRQSSIARASDHYHLGRQYAGEGEWEAALTAFESAVRLCPDNAIYHQDLGRVLMLLRRRDEAGIAFGYALRLQPDSPDILQDVGVYLLVCAVQEQSLQRCREARDLLSAIRNPMRCCGSLSAQDTSRSGKRALFRSISVIYLHL